GSVLAAHAASPVGEADGDVAPAIDRLDALDAALAPAPMAHPLPDRHRELGRWTPLRLTCRPHHDQIWWDVVEEPRRNTKRRPSKREAAGGIGQHQSILRPRHAD